MDDNFKSRKSIGEKIMRKLSMKERDSVIPIIKRKANKPLTEKRRRDRINKCLVQLKNIILKATGKEEKKFAKLEKAEILDMTINHLMEIHKNNKAVRAELAENMEEDFDLGISSVSRCMRRVNGVDDLRSHLKDSISGSAYQYPPVTPRYNCGYSGSRAIMDVNFEQDDILDREGLMCGSMSRVFVYGEEQESTSQYGRIPTHMRGSEEKCHISPVYGQSYDYADSQYYCGTESYRTTSTPITSNVTNGPKYTSTPVSSCRPQPYKTSTPLSKSRDLVSPPDHQLMRSQGCYNLRISPDLRMQLFTNSQHSSDSDSVKDSSSKSRDSNSSSGEGHWRPW